MATRSSEYLRGTLEPLILKTLASGPLHGYAIARWLETETDGVLAIEDGSLYPALYRLERRGWIEAKWGMSELGRRVKTYRLSRRGHRELERETEQWRRFSGAVSRVLLAPA